MIGEGFEFLHSCGKLFQLSGTWQDFQPESTNYSLVGQCVVEVVGGCMPGVVGGTWGGYLGDESIGAVCNMIVDHYKCIPSIGKLLLLLGTWVGCRG
jgi:hypothetical protein